MPFINISYSEKISKEIKNEILEIIKKHTGKPEKYIMISTEIKDITLNNKNALYIQYKQIGDLSREQKENILRDITVLFQTKGYDTKTMYTTFESFERDNWAINNKLFG